MTRNIDVNGHLVITVGETLICSETGKPFVAAHDGCSVNYARGTDGRIISDEGVRIINRRELLDRSKPFVCYLSPDGKHVTGWKGDILGDVIQTSVSSDPLSGYRRETLTHVRVKDVYGAFWYGKGSGRGMCITLRALKG